MKKMLSLVVLSAVALMVSDAQARSACCNEPAPQPRCTKMVEVAVAPVASCHDECPEGTTMNSETGMCDYTVTKCKPALTECDTYKECPEGTTMNANGQCEWTVVKERCPLTKRTTRKVCPAGTTMNAEGTCDYQVTKCKRPRKVTTYSCPVTSQEAAPRRK